MKTVPIILPSGQSITISEPDGFKVTEQGIFYLKVNKNDEVERIFISKLIWNEALVCFKHSDDIHYLVKGINVVTGGIFEKLVSRADLVAQNHNSLDRDLANAGAGIAFKRGISACHFLYAQSPTTVIEGITTTGWYTLKNGQKLFVSPNKIYSKYEESARYLPNFTHPAHKNIKPSCTVEEQKLHIANLCVNNPIPLFSIGFGLASLMSGLLNRNCASLLLFGLTSRGKTICAQLAASVVGNASDPNLDPDNTIIQTWNTTSNGLELMAIAFNGLPLVIDELGANSGKEFGQDMYKLYNGVAKVRMNAGGSPWHQDTWRASIFSTGEISAEQMLSNGSGNTAVKGGQLIRINDIPAQDIFTDTDELTAAEIADTLKQNCGIYYGAFGDTFLTYLADIANCPEQLLRLEQECTEAEDSLLDGVDDIAEG